MKPRKIIGAVVVVLVVAAGLWWFMQSGSAPVKIAVTAGAKSLGSPEAQYPVDPKSPSLHPPPSAPMVPPPAPPHSPHPTDSAIPAADPQADLKTAIPDIARLVQAADRFTFEQTYMPPAEWAKMEPQDIQDLKQRQARLAGSAQGQQINEDMAQTYASLANQTPTFNAAGDEATYIYTLPLNTGAPPGNSHSMTLVKINGKWYMKDLSADDH